MQERLGAFFRALELAPGLEAPFAAPDEVLTQIGTILEMVEDRYSGIAKNPKPGRSPDGRMYPPQEDSITRHRDGSITAETRGHFIEIAANGMVVFRSKRTGEIVFSKPSGGPP